MGQMKAVVKQMSDMNQRFSWKVSEAYIWDTVKKLMSYSVLVCLSGFGSHRALICKGGRLLSAVSSRA
jgi:hypothetical protein